jgi:hypothetical protein
MIFVLVRCDGRPVSGGSPPGGLAMLVQGAESNECFEGSVDTVALDVAMKEAHQFSPFTKRLSNKIVEATVTFRLFEGIGVVRGRGRAKLSEKRMHFVREKRDKPPCRRFHAGCVPLSPLFYRRCSSFAAKSFVS